MRSFSLKGLVGYRYLITHKENYTIFFVVLGFELRASHLLGSCSILEPFHQPFFLLGVFEIGPLELFAPDSFEP
jgi:hypothetical protein